MYMDYFWTLDWYCSGRLYIKIEFVVLLRINRSMNLRPSRVLDDKWDNRKVQFAFCLSKLHAGCIGRHRRGRCPV